jgi:hypothetical protein
MDEPGSTSQIEPCGSCKSEWEERWERNGREQEGKGREGVGEAERKEGVGRRREAPLHHYTIAATFPHLVCRDHDKNPIQYQILKVKTI